jgi:exopolysaccharide production protein ExoQ
MPSALALIAFSGFVYYMLRLDRKKSPDLSAAVWLPTIWMLSIASKPLARWFGTKGSIEASSPLDQVFHIALLCLGLFVIMRRGLNWPRVRSQNSWLIVLVGFMLISVVWCDTPFVAFKRWIRDFEGVIMAFVLLTEPDPRQAMESVLRRTVYVSITYSLLLVKYYQQYGVWYSPWTGEIQWLGITLQKNGLGRVCLVAAFFLIWTLTRRWQGRDIPVAKYQTHAEVLLLFMTFWLLKGPSIWAASATGIYSLCFGLAAFAGLLWMKNHRIKLGANTMATVIACIMVLGILQPLVGGAAVQSFTSAVGRNSTLTGRTEIWAGLIPDVMQSPILGYGFGSFWTEARRIAHDIGEAHNGYLEVCLEAGMVGLLLTAIFLLSFCRKAERQLAYDYDWGCLCLCYLLMAVIHNITESSFDSFTKHLMGVLLFLGVSCPSGHRVPLKDTCETRNTDKESYSDVRPCDPTLAFHG